MAEAPASGARYRFEAELRRFLGISAMIETPACPECLERREVPHHCWYGGVALVKISLFKVFTS